LRYIRIALRYMTDLGTPALFAGSKMVRIAKAVSARMQPSRQETAEVDADSTGAGLAMRDASPTRGGRLPSTVDPHVETRPESGSPIANGVSAAVPVLKPAGLSVRAENVLKELAVELIGEAPPKGRWTPPHQLLRKLTYRHLLTARNCGRQTTGEIIGWAESRGVVIRPPLHAGKSLSATWQDLIVKFSAGAITEAEIAEALERSVRRKNTRIPVAFQTILSMIFNSARE
jgi:hypothetical protein